MNRVYSLKQIYRDLNSMPKFYDISKSSEPVLTIDLLQSDGRLLEHQEKDQIQPLTVIRPKIDSGIIRTVLSFASGNQIFKSIKIW